MVAEYPIGCAGGLAWAICIAAIIGLTLAPETLGRRSVRHADAGCGDVVPLVPGTRVAQYYSGRPRVSRRIRRACGVVVAGTIKFLVPSVIGAAAFRDMILRPSRTRVMGRDGLVMAACNLTVAPPAHLWGPSCFRPRCMTFTSTSSPSASKRTCDEMLRQVEARDRRKALAIPGRDHSHNGARMLPDVAELRPSSGNSRRMTGGNGPLAANKAAGILRSLDANSSTTSSSRSRRQILNRVERMPLKQIEEEHVIPPVPLDKGIPIAFAKDGEYFGTRRDSDRSRTRPCRSQVGRHASHAAVDVARYRRRDLRGHLVLPCPFVAVAHPGGLARRLTHPPAQSDESRSPRPWGAKLFLRVPFGQPSTHSRSDQSGEQPGSGRSSSSNACCSSPASGPILVACSRTSRRNQ